MDKNICKIYRKKFFGVFSKIIGLVVAILYWVDSESSRCTFNYYFCSVKINLLFHETFWQETERQSDPGNNIHALYFSAGDKV